MNITVTLDGSLEEITVALNAIEAHKKRSNTLLPLVPKPLPTTEFFDKNIIPIESKKISQTGGTNKKPVDIYMGSIESGFAYHKTFDSISAVAKYVHATHPANISPYVKNGEIYKKIYKFKYHDKT